MVFGGAVAIWLLVAAPPWWFLIATIVLAAAAAGYSAFLFAQAEGRDFWQSSLLLPHLLTQAVVAGAGMLLLILNFTGRDIPENLDVWLSAGLILHLLMILGEVAVPHTNRDSALA